MQMHISHVLRQLAEEHPLSSPCKRGASYNLALDSRLPEGQFILSQSKGGDDESTE